MPHKSLPTIPTAPTAPTAPTTTTSTPLPLTLTSINQIRPGTTRYNTLVSLDARLVASSTTSTTKDALFDLQLARQLYLLADFVFVGLGDPSKQEAGTALYVRYNLSPFYRRITTEELARLAIQAATLLPSPALLSGSRVNRFLSTFLHEPVILPNIERRVFYISEGLLFDNTLQAGEQLLSPDSLARQDPDAKCFFRLFDSDSADRDIVTFPESAFDSSFSDAVLSAYNSLYSLLEPRHAFPEDSLSSQDQSTDPLPRHFPFVEAWADGNPGLYWDLLTIPATVFMRDKPPVAFFLSGASFNGKTAYLGLLHSLFGTRNTTRNKLSDFSKWHLNTLLQYTLFNAPDDEGDSISGESAEIFKSIASHGTVSLPIMRSQTPMRLNADFMTVHPMNAFPDWGDSSSASALTRRTILVPFTADFRDRPRVDNFAQTTFTLPVLAQFLGEVLAIASFYSNHPIQWSQTIEGAKTQVEAENDSVRLYKATFEKFFDGFQSLKLLYDDYVIWCRDNGYSKVADRGAFKIHWYAYTAHRRGKAALYGAKGVVFDSDKRPVRRNALMNPARKAIDHKRMLKGLPPLMAMLSETILPGPLSRYGTIEHMHAIQDLDKAVGQTSRSAVTLLEYAEGEYGEEEHGA